MTKTVTTTGTTVRQTPPPLAPLFDKHHNPDCDQIPVPNPDCDQIPVPNPDLGNRSQTRIWETDHKPGFGKNKKPGFGIKEQNPDLG